MNNSMRARHKLQLIDHDATTPMGSAVGLQFSSGSLYPEMFAILSREQVDQFEMHWAFKKERN